jgi:hypothetical protein
LDEFVKNTNTQLNKSNIDIGKSISTTVGNTKLVPGKVADAFDLRTNTLSNLDYANNTLQDVNKSTLTLGNSSRLLNSEFYSMGKSVNSSLSKINESLNLTSNSSSNSFGNFTVNPSVTSSVSSSAFSSSSAYEEKLNNINNKVVDVNKNTKEFNKTSTNTWRNNNNALRTSVSSFHNMNTMLSATASQFGVVGSAIAGVFGANGLSGMVEKMWSQATQRQTNMIYLMRRRGVKEASELYNEITDIVMELPGDDTFLTTILNQSAGMDKNLLKNTKCRVVLTPHPKEFERISGIPVAVVLSNPVESAKAFAREYGVILLLKGASTVVTDGEIAYICERGSAGMATAGSGDVLSGVLTGLLGYMEYSPLTVALGAYLAGAAGELAAEEYTSIAMTAGDTARMLPRAWKELML